MIFIFFPKVKIFCKFLIAYIYIFFRFKNEKWEWKKNASAHCLIHLVCCSLSEKCYQKHYLFSSVSFRIVTCFGTSLVCDQKQHTKCHSSSLTEEPLMAIVTWMAMVLILSSLSMKRERPSTASSITRRTKASSKILWCYSVWLLWCFFSFFFFALWCLGDPTIKMFFVIKHASHWGYKYFLWNDFWIIFY